MTTELKAAGYTPEVLVAVLSEKGVAQWQKAESVLGTSTIAVEHRHVQSLTTIARENFDYFRPVDQRSSRSQE